MATNWDVVVAGAGPAGSATAALLARAGYRVLLVDRAQFPRDKPCSDFLAPGARPILARLGVLDEIEHRSAAITAMEVTSPSGVRLRGRYASDGGLGLPRRELDALLVERAVDWGATLWERVRVENVLWRDGAVAGLWLRGDDHHRTAVEARLVVGADGLRSVVARALGRCRRAGPRRLALVARMAQVAGLHAAGEMFVTHRGYAGLAPLPGGVANVAVVIPARRASRGLPPDALFQEELTRMPALYRRVAGREVVRKVLATGPFGWRSRHVTAPGAMLVGDAARFFDPFTGDGLATALLGAAAAADAATAALSGAGPVSRRALRPYRRARRRLFWGRWTAQRLVGAAIARPLLLDAALALLAHRPSLGDRIVRFAGGGPLGALLAPLR